MDTVHTNTTAMCARGKHCQVRLQPINNL